MRLHRCRDRQLDDVQLVTEVCSKHLARSPFALQLQPPQLVERLVQAQVAQLARVQALVLEVELELVLERVAQLAREQALVQVAQLAREPKQPEQAPQPHSPHQQLQSQCQPELCHLH